jgi:hypothetical protein
MRTFLLAICILSATALPAAAHDWYEWACCHKQDCAPLAEAARAVKGGYMVKGLFFPNKLLRESRDHRWHACILNGKPRCLYAPMSG